MKYTFCSQDQRKGFLSIQVCGLKSLTEKEGLDDLCAPLLMLHLETKISPRQNQCSKLCYSWKSFGTNYNIFAQAGSIHELVQGFLGSGNKVTQPHFLALRIISQYIVYCFE